MVVKRTPLFGIRLKGLPLAPIVGTLLFGIGTTREGFLARDDGSQEPPPYVVDDAASWASSVQAALAWAVRQARSARGWSTSTLASECSKVGYPISRGTLAKLENGERTTLSVVEWLTLAYALGVPPGSLLIPYGSFLERSVVPGASPADAVSVDRWLAARAPLRDGPDDKAAWDRAVAPLAALREHERLIAEFWTNLHRLEEAIEEEERQPDSKPVPAGYVTLRTLAGVTRWRFRLWATAERLHDLRRRFTESRWVLPSLPTDIADTLAAAPWENMLAEDPDA